MASKLIYVQEAFLGSLEEDLQTLSTLPDNEKTEHKLKSFLKILENDFNDSRKYHTTLLKSEDPSEAEIIKSYLQSGLMTRIRQAYHSYWANLNTCLEAKSSCILTSTLNQSQVPIDKKSCDLKLPRIEIPTFSGSYEEWTEFYNLFIATIDNNQNLEAVQKLHYLLKAVSGEAHAHIKNLSVTGENYQCALKILKEQYDHKRKIAHVYARKLLDYPSIKNETSKELKGLLSTIKDCSASLEQLGLPIIEWDFLLLCIMQTKIPSKTYRDWEKKLGASRELPKFCDFTGFIEETYRMLEMIEPISKDFTKQKTFHTQTESKNTKPAKNQTTKKKEKKCKLCKGNHGVSRCQQFLSADLKKRREIQLEHKLCANCLGINHSAEKCYSFKSCIFCNKISNITSRHHSLLHDHSLPSSDSSTSQANLEQVPTSRNYHTVNSGVQTATLLATAQVRLINRNGFIITVRALIDPCSEDNYITNNTVQLLGLSKYDSPCTVSGIGDNSITNIQYRTEFKIESIDGKFKSKIDAAVTKKISQLIPSEPISPSACGFLNNLELADPNYNLPGEVHLLLGTGAYAEIVQPGLKKFGTFIFGQKTTLGWIIGGQTEKLNDRPNSRVVFMTKSNKESFIDEQLKKFWEIEEVPFQIAAKPEDQLCEDRFLSSINQRADLRFAVDLPFRHSNEPIIGPSRDIALRRFLNLEKKLNMNEELKREYHRNIQEYIDSKHMIPAEANNNGKEYFLPHHAVLKECSTTTKLRVVYDASCKSSDGTSLNDHLMIGPKLQTDIRDIIFNWRKYEFAYTADIARMYRMFWVNDIHQKYQKILWRFNLDDPIKDYKLTTVTFGVNCAPYLAIRILHYISEINQNKTEFEEACNALKTEFYVDDFLSGGHTIVEAVNKQTQLRKLLGMYGLNIRKWSSNNLSILEGIPKDQLELKTELQFDETDFRKTLGIYWTPKNDFFKFSIDKECADVETLTKRKALSLISRLYDPMGWASPCTMFTKVLMQEIWKTKIGWDDEVCDSIKQKFILFFREPVFLEKVEIPRWVKLVDANSPVTLIGFCDASCKGYGAVLYLKQKTDDALNQTENDLILLASKTKVSPINFCSIPRLELCGALLLSELTTWASRLLLPRKVEVIAFSDSQVVLHWLRSHPSKWKPYIASRTTKILQNIDASKWFYVHTSKNPADFASKGILPSQLVGNKLWWNGPQLINVSDTEQGLSADEQEIIDKEMKAQLQIFQTRKVSNELLIKYSSYYKLFNILKYCCKFISNILFKISKANEKFNNKFAYISQKISNPETIIMRMVQKEVFHNEILDLQKNKPLDSKSNIASLYPFLDGFGVLRVGGRLQNSSLTYNQKHPMILPSSHQITNNIIREAHENLLHAQENLTLSYLRNKYHIIRASDRVKYVINKCVTCRRYAKEHQQQVMGELPKDRISINRPFLNSGVDYAGPILTREKGRGKTVFKSYIALFICMSTKAMHLEVVSDLSSQAFLAAFRRFVNRRGFCQTLYSDNGTNFVGSKKILVAEIKKAEMQWKSELNHDFQKMKTNWVFNPPSAPHFGGLWEAGVKSVKTHLIRTIGNKSLTFEELSTILVQIEGILNSRPMCPISNDPNCYIALTPAHFILGEALVTPPEPILETRKSIVDRWLHLQTVRQQFWKSYVNDYLNRLQRRPKWLKNKITFHENDLVLVKDDNLPPVVWPLAKVIKLHPGNDGVVRVVTLKNSSGRIFQRPTRKLRLLPVNETTE